MPGPLAEIRGDPETAVFSGIVDGRDARGYPVTITRWFQGGGVFEPRVWFTAGSFSGDGASCGTTPLPVGTEWIFAAYRTEGMYGTGLCSPHAAIATPEGQAMLADALQTFGQPPPVATGPPAGPAEGSDLTAVASAFVGALGPLLFVIVFGVGLLLGLVAILRRSRLGQG